MKVRVERGRTPHVSSERPQWMIRRRCLVAETLLAAATSRLGVGMDGTPVLDGIGTRRGMIYLNVDDEENHTQSGEAGGDVGLQKPPRHRTKGAAPQGTPKQQHIPRLG
eukprot:scaffold23818_cov39-Cyclotella_meneghiniana.AAC.3